MQGNKLLSMVVLEYHVVHKAIQNTPNSEA
jgi:hypothetical protein